MLLKEDVHETPVVWNVVLISTPLSIAGLEALYKASKTSTVSSSQLSHDPGEQFNVMLTMLQRWSQSSQNYTVIMDIYFMLFLR